MIQRIQSIFLLLGSGSAFGLLGLPFATTNEAQASSDSFADGVYNIYDDPALLGAFIAAGALLLIAIFLFKNRKLQAKLTTLVLGVIGFGIGFAAYELYNDSAKALAQVQAGVALPILGLIFAGLAIRNINKDEALVRSVDRLR